MRSIVKLFVIAGPLILTSAHAAPPLSAPAVGAEYEITRSYETSNKTNEGSSSGSSRGHTTLLERVVAVRDNGLELEYDFPRDATAEDRARDWQFPARIFKPQSGPLQLLNSNELEQRLELWLKAANWTREVCGRWIFTWNAFHIDCDPQSVLKTIQVYDLRPSNLREGASYVEEEAIRPRTLTRKTTGSDATALEVALEIDPEKVRRARAQSDVAVGEIMRKPVTLAAALDERAKDRISGIISVTFDMGVSGNIWRRTRITKVETTKPDGRIESDTMTEIVERKMLSAPSDQK